MRHLQDNRAAVVFAVASCLWVSYSLDAQTLPWSAAGLDERQAAAHLLDRFAFGPRPGDIDRALAQGLEEWLDGQLSGRLADPDLDRRLGELESWQMPASEITRLFLRPDELQREAMAAGALTRDELVAPNSDDRQSFRQQYRELAVWGHEQGYRPQRDLASDLLSQKVLRAAFSERQLEAVLVDFWFNHFNVSMSDIQARVHVLSYERDAILPRVLGSFHDLLVAAAMHPAMLYYLDNAQSTAEEGTRTTADARMVRARGRRRGLESRRRPDDQRQRPSGLNENYARELLELHTLGVDGGYDQTDVVEVARAFTGWAALPRPLLDSERLARLQSRRGTRAGFVVRGGFVFRSDAHDAGVKTVLGRQLPGGRGIEDGLDVLEMLSAHPSTARHLARKLATRFVADEPPAELVERLTDTYLDSGGDIAAMLRGIAYAPEFWGEQARRQKIKSPFELAVSSLRALDAEVVDARPIGEWVSRMGQPLYNYQAPTGFPDSAESWVNSGALLSRMNFGLNLAAGRIPGIEVDLADLDQNREPSSMTDALETYVGLLMPGRDGGETLGMLRPVVSDPRFAERLAEAAPASLEAPQGAMARRRGPGDFRPRPEGGRGSMMDLESVDPQRRAALLRQREQMRLAMSRPPSALANVVGVILGSPEFQRR